LVYTFHNAEVVVDDLGERGEAVGGAGGVRHHVVARLVLLVVHTLKTHLYKLETEIAVLWIRMSGYGSGPAFPVNPDSDTDPGF
jgi:hypothetical protein